MKSTARLLIASALCCAAFACNNPPAPTAAPHPPVSDLTVFAADDPVAPDGACVAEALAPDPDDPATTSADFTAWQRQVLLAGRGCRDTVKRLCKWHVDNGADDLASVCRRN